MLARRDGQLAWNWPPEQREEVALEATDVWGLGVLYACMRYANPTPPDITDTLQVRRRYSRVV
jgi:hypothetical protein